MFFNLQWPCGSFLKHLLSSQQGCLSQLFLTIGREHFIALLLVILKDCIEVSETYGVPLRPYIAFEHRFKLYRYTENHCKTPNVIIQHIVDLTSIMTYTTKKRRSKYLNLAEWCWQTSPGAHVWHTFHEYKRHSH